MLDRQVLVAHVGAKRIGGFQKVAALARKGGLVRPVSLRLAGDALLDLYEQCTRVDTGPGKKWDGHTLGLGEDRR